MRVGDLLPIGVNNSSSAAFIFWDAVSGGTEIKHLEVDISKI